MSHISTGTPGELQRETPAPTIGARLFQLRKRSGLSVEQVSQKTHISCSNIIAIETESFEDLPADTFVRGLVTIYGDFIGGNGAEMAVIFLRERDQNQPLGQRKRFFRNNNSLAPKRLAEPSHFSSASLAVFLLLVIIFSFTSFCTYTGWNPFGYFLKESTPAIIPLSETIAQEPKHNTTSSAKQPILPGQQEKTPYTLTALFTKDTALEVIVDEKEPVHLQGIKGEKLQIKAGKSMQLLFDQPNSAKITVNKTRVSFPSNKQNGKLSLTLPAPKPNT